MYEYNPDGNLFRVRAKHTEGSAWRDTTYAYTGSWAVDTVTDPELNITNFDYDDADRVTMVTDPSGRKTRTFYFPDGQVRKILKGYEFTAASTDESCSIVNTDQQCYARYAYAPAGGDPALFDGQVYSVRDANGNETKYTYDLYDRREKTTYSDTSFEQLGYDEADNVKTRRNRGNQTVNFTYNALNKLLTKTQASFPDGDVRLRPADAANQRHADRRAGHFLGVRQGGAPAIHHCRHAHRGVPVR